MPDEKFRERQSRLALVLDFLKSRLITVLILLTILAAVWMYVEPDLTLSREARLIGLTALAVAPAGWFAGNYITSLLYDPQHVFLIDLDARELDGAIYQMPYDRFVELTVLDENGNQSQMYDITQLTPNLHVGKQVDLDEMTVQGTWRGTLDDVELAKSLQAVVDCRNQLQEDAQKGFALEVNASTIVRSASRDVVLDVVRTVEDGTLPGDGEQITGAVDDALKAYDWEDDAVESAIDELHPKDLDAREQRDQPDDQPTEQPQPQSQDDD